ncbi:MAG TPA: DUF1456 family protein [Mariprofundaceae bacterium]|nr:DUF1456 family protein [Mariprofundaceae bacterium]
MDNNRILKKIIIANNLRHFEVQEVFALGGLECSSSRIKGFLAGSRHKNHERLDDEALEQFLNGLIVYARGALDEPEMLPRGVENYLLGLIESGNDAALEEIKTLLAEAGSAQAGREEGEDDGG